MYLKRIALLLANTEVKNIPLLILLQNYLKSTFWEFTIINQHVKINLS